MTNDQIDRWQEALRSGECKQIVGAWASGDYQKQCCLDVAAVTLCNVHVNNPISARRYLGLSSDMVETFLNANDSLKMNFDEIADLIEFMRKELRSE